MCIGTGKFLYNTSGWSLPREAHPIITRKRGCIMDYETFVRNRITQLRLSRGISEYQMSYDLGHSRGYVYNISSGKALPPLREFFAICEYFRLTPQQFFDTSTSHPELIQKAVTGMNRLSESDQLMILSLITRLSKEKTAP